MEKWSSKTGFLLAAIGAAVGIGNVWRFSAVVGQNGGGAYLIPYLLAVFCFGVPLMIVELAIGRNLRANLIAAFSGARARLAGLGWIVWCVVLLILGYYLVIVGWTLAYVHQSLTGNVMSFSAFTGTLRPVVYFLLTALVTGLVVSFGVRRGIERISTVLMPLCFVMLVAMAVFATTLSGFSKGIAYFLKPDFDVLLRPSIWSAAFGQAFFSLSVGYGAIITYGAYLDERTDIPRSSIIISVADVSVAVLAGLVVFPIVFTFGLEPTLGAELAFSTLPRAFEMMPAGRFFSPAFFLLLFFAGLTSAVSMMEANVAPLLKTGRASRARISMGMTAGVMVIGLPAALSYSAPDLRLAGMKVLDLMDETVGTLGLPITALMISLAFTWFFPKTILRSEIDGGRKLSAAVHFAAKYVIPTVLSVVTVSRLVTGFDFPGWHWIPGIPYIGRPGQLLTLIVFLVALAASTMLIARRRERRP